eukprot:Rmarinus@m.2595
MTKQGHNVLILTSSGMLWLVRLVDEGVGSVVGWTPVSLSRACCLAIHPRMEPPTSSEVANVGHKLKESKMEASMLLAVGSGRHIRLLHVEHWFTNDPRFDPEMMLIVEHLKACGQSRCQKKGSCSLSDFDEALSSNLSDCAKYMLAINGSLCRSCDDKGHTTLHMAAANGCLDIIRYLIEVKRCDDLVSRTTNLGETMLHIAGLHGNVNVIRYIVERGYAELLRKTADSGDTLLHMAVGGGYLKKVQSCLEELGQAEIGTFKNKIGKTAAQLEQVVSRRGSMNTFVKEGNALFEDVCSAVLDGLLPCVKFLTTSTCGQFLSAVDEDGCTLLHMAAAHGAMGALQYLSESVAPFMLRKADESGDTVLHYSARSGNIDAIMYFVEERGVEDMIWDTNHDGMTVLHVASLHGRIDVIRYLLEEREARHLIFMVSNDGYTVFHYAAWLGHIDVIQYFVEKMYVVSLLFLATNEKDTVLHFAAREGYLDLVRYLVEDIKCTNLFNLANVSGKTAVDLANINGRSRVVQYLRSMMPAC